MGRKIIRKPQQLYQPLNLKEYYEKRNRILIFRGCGGLGDIFMHRMMFEDFKKIMPDSELHFSCPAQYHPAVEDHPFIDKLIDSKDGYDKNEYIISYNTTNACGRYEMSKAPLSGDHRSDIWANHCGVELTQHNMHIKLTDKEIQRGKELVENKRDREGPIIAFCPISAMATKDLLPHQIKCLVDEARNKGCYIFGMHYHPIKELQKLDVPMLFGLGIREWMGVLYAADYVISVDTSAGHFAGGIGKPLLSIFTFADGKVYTKYYPNTVLVQKHRDNGDWSCGPCYNWSLCPKTQQPLKPCLTEITNQMLKNGLDFLFARFPLKA